MHEIGDQEAVLRAKINQETATAPWSALQRFFAQGKVVSICRGLDLVDVAISMSRDRADEIEDWIDRGQLVLISDAQAREWLKTDALLWTVVVKPWILVQELDPAKQHDRD